MSMIFSINEYLRNARKTGEGRTAGQIVPGICKEYARIPRIELPAPRRIDMPLRKALEKRVSCYQSAPGKPFGLEDMSTLLGHALGEQRHRVSRRTYPSGGALFPIETYLIGNVLEGHPPSALHYNPRIHVLEHLWDLPADFDISKMSPSANMDSQGSYSTLLIFTGVWERARVKYGNFAYLLGFLETGHMSQNILLVSTALNTCACPVDFVDERVIEILDLDVRTEQPVHAIALSSSKVVSAT